MYKRTPTHKKLSIITEYLTGSLSYRQLGKKHGIESKTIHHWVMKHEGRIPVKKKVEDSNQSSVSVDIKDLQEELRKANLENKLLKAMIEVAQEQLNIDIRKKSGTRQ